MVLDLVLPSTSSRNDYKAVRKRNSLHFFSHSIVPVTACLLDWDLSTYIIPEKSADEMPNETNVYYLKLFKSIAC